MKTLNILCIASILTVHSLSAETSDPIANGIMNGTYQTSELGSSYSAQRFTTEDSTIIYTDEAGKANSRRDAAATAADDSQRGNDVHTQTGNVLTIEGSIMMTSVVESVRVAGAEMVAMGVIEYLQAGADNDAKNSNTDQKNLLMPTDGAAKVANGDGNYGNGTFGGQSDIQKALDTPEFKAILEKNGVNPSEFIAQVSSGTLTTGAAIMQAAGITNVSDSEREKGLQLAQTTALEKIEQVHGEKLPDGSRFAYNQNANSGSDANANSKGNDKNSSALNPNGQGKNGVAGKGNPVTDGNSKGAANSGLTSKSSLDEILAKLMGVPKEKLTAELRREGLERLGVAGDQKNFLNIFQRAHRSYRAWGKWRNERKRGLRVTMSR